MRLVAALVVALVYSPGTPASPRFDDPALLDLSLEQLLGTEVRSASWSPSPLREATASVTVFERRDLERMGVRHLHEVLNFVPGAYTSRVASTGLENRTVLRGNPGTAGGGLLVIDGQRANSFQSVRPWGVLRHFPLALVERVEIIRGPGSARFGGGPSDEVVHVITRRDEGAAGLRASAEGGAGGFAMLGGAWGDWRLHLRAARADDQSPRYEGLFDRFGRIEASTVENRGETALLDLGWRGHNVQVMHHGSDIRGYYGLNGSISPGDQSELDATWWRYAGGAEFGGWQADWSASRFRQRFALSAVLAPAGQPPFLAEDARQRGLFTHRAEGASLTLRRGFGAHTLTVGGETLSGRNTRADLQSNYRLAPPFDFLGDYQSTGLRFSALGARERMTALYLEDDWRLSPRQRLVLGLRHDRYAGTGSATSPRLGWVWSPDTRCSVKLLYQEAFFAPTLGQRFLQNNPVIDGNPDLDPTRVRTWELVGQRQWDTVLWRASLYHRRAKDGFAVIPGAAAAATTVNAVRQRSDGVETSLHWTPAQDWRLRLTASALLRDDYVLPASLAEAPPGEFVSRRSASALLTWRPNAWEWTAGAHWRSREGLQPRENDPRTMLQVNWRPAPDLRLWLHADNLFNARGVDIDVAGGLGTDPATGEIARLLPLPGREVLLGVEYRWR